MSGSRSFASGDHLDFALGTAPTAAFTVMVVLKPSSASADQTWLCDRSSANYVFGLDGGQLAIFGSSSNYVASPLPRTTAWQNMIYAKSAGSTPGVFSRVPLDGSSVTHANASGGNYPDSAATVGWRIGKAMFSGYDFSGLIAAVAVFNRYVGSADRATTVTLAAIEALRPLHLWDERDGFTRDFGSGGANRTAISGTSHSTDEPSGFWGSAPPTPDGAMVGAGDGHAVVFWTESTGATGYKVYRDGVEVYDGRGVGDRGTVAFDDTGLRNGTTYSYTVTAYSGSESAPTSAMRATPVAATVETGGSRDFGGSDLVRFLPGIEPQEQTNASFVVVLKPDSVRSAMGLLRADASPSQGDAEPPFVLRTSSSGELLLDVYNPVSRSTSASGIRLTAGVWQMVGVTWFQPNRAPPRFHHRNMSTGVNTHADGTPDHTYAIHPHGTWTVGDGFDGQIALAAVTAALDDRAFAALNLRAITAAAYAQWDELDSFLDDQSGGDALAARHSITGTSHSRDEPSSFW